jgi:membrane protease YdiL (CAAX protease family)
MNSSGEPIPAGGELDRGKRDRKDMLLYALLVIGITNLVVGTFPLLHIKGNWAVNTLMFVPGLVALALRLQGREGFRSVGWGSGRLIYWIWGMVLPVIVLVVTLPISIGLGYVALAQGASTGAHLASHPVKILENVVIYTAISLPFAFGEEFGWRGYAQPKLVRQYGLAGGLLLLGIIWGLWHTPIYCFADAYPKHPFFGPFVMTPIDNVLAVVPMGWLYAKSKSIWVPTLTHAFADVLWGFSGLLFPATQEIESWAVLQAAQLILSVVLLVDLNRQSKRADTSRVSSPPSVAVGGHAAPLSSSNVPLEF